MPESATRILPPHVRSGRREGPFASYAPPGRERPLGSYVVLAGVYGAATASGALALRRAGRPLPEHPRAADPVLIGVVSHKISRLLAKDKVTSFLRAPFTRFQEASGQGEVEEEACGHGIRYAVGELLICPYCLSQWVATGLTLGVLASPRLTGQLCAMFSAHTVPASCSSPTARPRTRSRRQRSGFSARAG